MVILDVSIVNVALPKIGDSLSFSTTGLEWIVNAYTLTFSGLLGGILTDGLGWPAIFSINVPLGIAVVLLGRRVIPEGRNEHATRNFDVTGATLVTAGLFAITYGIVRTDVLGWGSAGVLAPLAAGVALIGLFALVEGRFAQSPLVPLSVFRMRQLRGANLAVFLMYSALFALWFFLTLYLQQVLGFSAIEAGLAFLPMTLSVVAGSSLAPRLITRFGVRATVTGALLVSTAGMLLLTGVSPDGTYPAQVLPGGVLTALALGIALVGSTIAAVQGVPQSQSGLASGPLNTSRLMAGALGLAVLG